MPDDFDEELAKLVEAVARIPAKRLPPVPTPHDDNDPEEKKPSDSVSHPRPSGTTAP
jgi:hypothetical protein